VIISNTDRHIIEQTLRQLAPLTFDAVVVAEDMRCYKPATTAFRRALEHAGARPEEILHASTCSAAPAGARTARRINRRRGWRP